MVTVGFSVPLCGPILLVFVLATLMLGLSSGCGRPPDDFWAVVEEDPPLAKDLVTTPPAEVFWFPRPAFQEGSGRKWAVRVVRTVRQRGPEVPTIFLSVEEDLALNFRVISRDDRSNTLRVTVSHADITVDPPIGSMLADLRQSREGTVLRLFVDGFGRIEKVARVRLRGGGSEDLDPPARDLEGTLRRLWSSVPDRPVQVGDGWDFRLTSTRPLPSGGDARETLTGRYHFLGMVVTVEGTSLAAVVGLDYEIAISGPGRETPRVTGTGIGRGVFFLDRETGEVLRAQVVESCHVQVDWPGRRKPRRVEQLSRGFFETTVEKP